MKRLSLSAFLLCGAAALFFGCSRDGNSGNDPDGGTSDGGTSDGSDDGGVHMPPPVICALPALPADVSTPTTVVGTGSAASCSEAALTAAINTGGVITFSCGAAPHTIVVTSEKSITKDTILDGGGKVTLSGGGASRILRVASTFDKETPAVTVQNLRFTAGSTRALSGATTANGGGAIFRMGGKLTVINSTFDNNECPQTGQDVAGGAIFSNGIGETIIVGSTFTNNSCSNGGALGNLGNGSNIVNTTITGNHATGRGGNPGNGGNGGGISVDGRGKTISLCGVNLSNNQGSAFGGGLFRVSYEKEPTNINASTVDGNSIPDVSGQPSHAGGLYLQGTTANITSTTVSNNSARFVGGVYLGPLAVANFTNVTISGNSATGSLGGGLVLSDSGSDPVSGTLLNCTISFNRAPASNSFGGGIAGGLALVKLQNTIVSNNVAGNAYNPINCTKKLGSGGPNMQNPMRWASGVEDATQAPCADGVTVADPKLAALGQSGGPTATHVPAQDSPARGVGTGCPPTDQRGMPRQAACTLGAVE